MLITTILAKNRYKSLYTAHFNFIPFTTAVLLCHCFARCK